MNDIETHDALLQVNTFDNNNLDTLNQIKFNDSDKSDTLPRIDLNDDDNREILRISKVYDIGKIETLIPIRDKESIPKTKLSENLIIKSLEPEKNKEYTNYDFDNVLKENWNNLNKY